MCAGCVPVAVSRACWYFRWDNDAWTHQSIRWLDRVFNGTDRVDGKHEALLLASIVLELEDGLPMGIARSNASRSGRCLRTAT